jgi:hypothetical protein
MDLLGPKHTLCRFHQSSFRPNWTCRGRSTGDGPGSWVRLGIFGPRTFKIEFTLRFRLSEMTLQTLDELTAYADGWHLLKRSCARKEAPCVTGMEMPTAESHGCNPETFGNQIWIRGLS